MLTDIFCGTAAMLDAAVQGLTVKIGNDYDKYQASLGYQYYKPPVMPTQPMSPTKETEKVDTSNPPGYDMKKYRKYPVKQVSTGKTVETSKLFDWVLKHGDDLLNYEENPGTYLFEGKVEGQELDTVMKFLLQQKNVDSVTEKENGIEIVTRI